MVLLHELTADILDRFDEEAEENRLAVLVDKELKDLGKAWIAQKNLLNMVEVRCSIRASRLRHLGYEPQEIAEQMNVEPKHVRAWLKGVKPSVIV